jgi:hypothetical protein
MLMEIQSAANAFALGDRFLDRLVGDFTGPDWAVRDAAGHDPRWIVGHIAASRRRVLGLLGCAKPAEPWEAHFGRGSSPGDLPAELDMKALVEDCHASQAAMDPAWATLTVGALAEGLGRTLPDGTDTVCGALRFLAWHEAYHLGQLGLFRRLAGKPGLA